MISGISGIGWSGTTSFSTKANEIDTDEDGVVTRDEFIAGAPEDLSSEKAGALFDMLDTEGTGQMTISALSSAFEKMSGETQASVLQAQSEAGAPPDPSELFAQLDADEDGSVTREEFLAGRPDDVSEEQANALFDKIAGEDGESVTEEQFVAGMQPPSMGGEEGGPPDLSQMFSDLDADGDGTVTREEFLAGRPDDVSEEDANALFDKIAGEDGESVTEEEFVAGMQPPPPPPAGGEEEETETADSEEMFDALDTNEDGVVSREEFLAGRPDDMSEDQANAFFNRLAGEDADSLTQEQFASVMSMATPPQGRTV